MAHQHQKRVEKIADDLNALIRAVEALEKAACGMGCDRGVAVTNDTLAHLRAAKAAGVNIAGCLDAGDGQGAIQPLAGRT